MQAMRSWVLGVALSLVLGCSGREPLEDVGRMDGTSTDTASPTDGGAPSDSFAAYLRGADRVIASARAEARMGGRVECTSEVDGRCLREACSAAAGCVYASTFTYESSPATDGGRTPLLVRAQTLQLAARGVLPDRARLLILNHGGTSIGTDTLEVALLAVARGFHVLLPTYRGSGGSDGTVEGCLGEGDDVARLASLLRATSTETRLMMGGSHGGCVLLRALELGAPVDAAVALWPGTDAARRYRANAALVATDGPLTAASRRCGSATSACCRTVRSNESFVRGLVASTEDLVGALPDLSTRAYACDSPAVAAPGVWTGLDRAEMELCRRSPLRTAPEVVRAFAGPLLILHGERDPYIRAEESCHFATQSLAEFAVRRLSDSGRWEDAGAPTGCEGVRTTHAAPDAAWEGARHLVLVEPLGHGDTGRPDLADACSTRTVASPDIPALAFAFLDAKAPR